MKLKRKRLFYQISAPYCILALFTINSVYGKTSAAEWASVWNQKQKRFVTSNLLIADALKKNLGSIRSNGAIRFFESDVSFRHWFMTTKPADPQKARLEYGSGKSPYIKACLANTAPSEEKRVVSKFSLGPTCIRHGNKVDYQVYKENNIIRIDLTRRLVYQSDKKNYALVKQKIDAAQACVRSIYANHGIHLTFNYSFSEPGVTENPDQYLEDINIYDDYPRSNARHWGILSDQGDLHTSTRVCTLIAHELGHHLGLDDSYEDPECPYRPPPNSQYDLMTDSSNPPELTRINEAEIKKMLTPLCEGKVDAKLFPEAPDYSTFFSVALGAEKFGTNIPDFGYVLSMGYTRMSTANVFMELQLNYAQPGLLPNNMSVFRDNFHFGYSQALVNFGYVFGRYPFWRSYAGFGPANPSFLAVYFGLGLHIWNYGSNDQRAVIENNPFAANQSFPNNRTAWVFDGGLSYFIIRQLQLRLQYSFISTDKPHFQTIGLMVQYNIFY